MFLQIRRFLLMKIGIANILQILSISIAFLHNREGEMYYFVSFHTRTLYEMFWNLKL